MVPRAWQFRKHFRARQSVLKGSLRFLLARQLRRRIIHLAPADLIHLFFEARAVVALGVRERPRLALVIPAPGIEPLRLFEVRDRFCRMSSLVELLAQAKLGGSKRNAGDR